jgi:hypothetical protein
MFNPEDYRQKYVSMKRDLAIYTIVLIISALSHFALTNVWVTAFAIAMIPIWLYFGMFTFLCVRQAYKDVIVWNS